MKIQKSTWHVIGMFVFLSLFVILCSGCAQFLKTLIYDFKHTNFKEPVPFHILHYEPEMNDSSDWMLKPYIHHEPQELDYHCYLEHAKEEVFLWKKYKEWCLTDSTLILGYYPNDNWPYETWDYDTRWVYREPTFKGFMEWKENVYIKSFENE